MKVLNAVRQVTQVSINASGRFISIPIYLVQKALKMKCNDIPTMYFRVSVRKNNGLVLVFRPDPAKNPKYKPFRGWKCNEKSKRYYISAVSILDSIKIPNKFLRNHKFPATVEEGMISIVLPKVARQVEKVKADKK